MSLGHSTLSRTIEESGENSAPLTLLSVYSVEDHQQILYDLLKERTPQVSISHSDMPSWQDHVSFVKGEPYNAWMFLTDGNEILGVTYLTRKREIGVQIFDKHQGQGYGEKAVRLLMERYPRSYYLANVNPHNDKSANLFRKLGFDICQHTYRRRT